MTQFDDVKIEEGSFVLVCGKSAGGKTTLLKGLMKRYQDQGVKCGYVMQNFDAQIVTDKVWHELSFALENLGYDRPTMERRVAEVCSYFGIEDWLEKDTALLSGGQKQLLNLASVMAATPQLLLLDEPTSQLDPVSAQNFINTVKKINEEFGITVVMSEHRLEELYFQSDRVLFVRDMQVAYDGNPRQLCAESEVKDFLPLSTRLAQRLEKEGKALDRDLPLTIKEGRTWLEEWLRAWSPLPTAASARRVSVSEGRKARPDERSEEGQLQKPLIQCKNLAFKYDDGPLVLDGMTFSVYRGEIFAGVGANGSGKSTLLKILCGLKKPLKGKIRIEGAGRVFMLPQNVKNIFTRRTVEEELGSCGWKAGMELEVLDSALLKRHPYDISGGEMQKLALEMILLKKPDIILLDEPTKGLDNTFKNQFGEILRKLAASGMTVILVCHDLDFCASVADRVSMVFEGRLLGTASPREFFGGNNFYTTSVNKLTRGLVEGQVDQEELLSCLL